MIDLEKLRESVRAHQKHELDIEFCPDYILRLADYIAQLEKENIALQRDAGRYSYVRRHVGFYRTNNGKGPVSSYLLIQTPAKDLIAEETDQAIDTAMEASNEA